MELISNKYRKLNEDLHNRAVFGQRGARHRMVVIDMLREFDALTVLDYGCGRADLAASMPGFDVRSYDPGIPARAKLPEQAEIVVCTDVLEHIEPELLDNVLAHINELTTVAAHLVIATKPDGNKKLADGRDPHLIVESPEWWQKKLAQHFDNVRCINVTARDCTFRVIK